MPLIALFILLHSNAYSIYCPQIFANANNKIDVEYTSFNHDSAQLVALYNNNPGGLIVYSRYNNGSTIKIDTSHTFNEMRKKGVQTALVRKIMEIESPIFVETTLAGTNKETFLKSVTQQVHQKIFKNKLTFNEKNADQFKLGEAYLLHYFKNLEEKNMHTELRNEILTQAAFDTPRGKTLIKHGFNNVQVVIADHYKYIDDSKKLTIILYFSSKSKKRNSEVHQ
ncbi:MAG: hypothetical protein HOO06_02615 [Bdellovibrionaceae bacterium]|nr:hypothetical protein [Pseudobdellovibrionaceae bacterium]